jgi:3',5'-cyclic AMP phosphodiesterase CpdA
MSRLIRTVLFALLLLYIIITPHPGVGADYPPFGVIGDTKIGVTEAVYKRFLEKTGREGIDLIFIVGDVIDHPGAAKEWTRFLELTGTQRAFHIAPGNHDINSSKSLKVYEKIIQKPLYYAFAQNDIQFIILCTELPGETSRVTGKQLEWLKNTLTEPFRQRIVFLHKPLFPTTFGRYYDLDKYPEDRDILHDLFVKSDVKLVFSGHEHLYNRSEKDGITYVITGGGGSRLLAFDEERGGFFHYIVAKRGKEGYIFNVYDINETLRDTFYLKQ